jgi:hypothetical protein
MLVYPAVRSHVRPSKLFGEIYLETSRNTSVGIGTGSVIFSSPQFQTSFWTHLASPMDTGSSFPGGKAA